MNRPSALDHLAERRRQSTENIMTMLGQTPEERGGAWESSAKVSLRDLFVTGQKAGYQLRRDEERAGEEPLDYDTFRSMLAQGFHTAFRKATDHSYASVIWLLIDRMSMEDWGAVLSFTADPIWAILRDSGTRAAENDASHAAKLADLAEHILAHLVLGTENERRERVVRMLVNEVLDAGYAIGKCEQEAVKSQPPVKADDIMSDDVFTRATGLPARIVVHNEDGKPPCIVVSGLIVHISLLEALGARHYTSKVSAASTVVQNALIRARLARPAPSGEGIVAGPHLHEALRRLTWTSSDDDAVVMQWKAVWEPGVYIGKEWVPFDVLEELPKHDDDVFLDREKFTTSEHVTIALVGSGVASRREDGGLYPGPVYREFMESIRETACPGEDVSE